MSARLMGRLALLLCMSSCASKTYLLPLGNEDFYDLSANETVVDVAILQNVQSVHFEAIQPFDIVTPEGRYLARDFSAGEWKAQRRKNEVILTSGSGQFIIPFRAYLIFDSFLLSDVPVGTGFHWERKTSRRYAGRLSFAGAGSRKMDVINTIELETYVQGVVPGEMPGSFPVEALKAQAIAARSEVLRKLVRGNHHLTFDICATVHCQVYTGFQNDFSKSSEAVLATKGMHLSLDGEIPNATYTGVCGGHTENNENVWEGEAQQHLRGIIDLDARPDLLQGALKNDDVVEKWVNNNIPVLCNTDNDSIPSWLGYAKKYFRWSRSFTRQQLENSIASATGKKIGRLKELKVLARGVSGRISRLEVIGTRSSFVIEKELAIRRALDKDALFSSCFFIKEERRGGSLPDSFVFNGAGWGHGVGMCQVGAAVMALRHATYIDILKHYYSGVEIVDMLE